MSQSTHIFRLAVILERINRAKVCSFEDLLAAVRRQGDLLALNDESLKSEFSKRTLQRDLKLIKEQFGVDIAYSKSLKGYHFTELGLRSQKLDFLLESFQLLQVFGLHETVSKHMFPDTHRQPTSHLFRPILEAIRSRSILEVVHKRFESETTRTFWVAPYGLKEAQGRWYLVAEDSKDGVIKTFALDRIVDVLPKDRPFEIPAGFDVERHFEDCFGIIKPLDEDPLEIELWISPEQAPYVLTLPLHHSQKTVKRDEEGLTISLYLYPTYDFIMELRKLGPDVAVVSPPELSKQVAWWKYPE